MQRPIAYQEIEAYVRQGLGCGCPDEVFRDIGDELSRLAGVQCQRLSIGGRLLVYRVLEAVPPQPIDQARAMLEAGRRERDALGFNRLRIVLPQAWLQAEPGLGRLADALGDSSRLHLHFEPEGW